MVRDSYVRAFHENFPMFRTSITDLQQYYSARLHCFATAGKHKDDYGSTTFKPATTKTPTTAPSQIPPQETVILIFAAVRTLKLINLVCLYFSINPVNTDS
jgi:hypothetical protein